MDSVTRTSIGERTVVIQEGMAPLGSEGPDPTWWSYRQFSTVGELESVHHVPSEAFVHVANPVAECLCGPTSTWVQAEPELQLLMVAHKPLAASFYDDSWSDTGPIVGEHPDEDGFAGI